MVARKTEVRLVLLDSIEWLDTDSQLRIDLPQEHVDRMASALEASDEQERQKAKRTATPVAFRHLPAIHLFTDGGLLSPYYIGDGYLRFHAYRKAHRDTIKAEVHICEDPRFEAFVYALCANLPDDSDPRAIPRSAADTRNVISRALESEFLISRGPMAIAKLCRVEAADVEAVIRQKAAESFRQGATTVSVRDRQTAIEQVLSDKKHDDLSARQKAKLASDICGHRISPQTILNHLAKLNGERPKRPRRRATAKQISPQTLRRRKLRELKGLLAQAETEFHEGDLEKFLREACKIVYGRYTDRFNADR